MDQDKPGSCCHAANSPVGGIRHIKPLRKISMTDPMTNTDVMKNDRGGIMDWDETRPLRNKTEAKKETPEDSEDQREEQCRGPDRGRSLYWSRARKGGYGQSTVRKGERYRMRSNSQGRAHAGQAEGISSK